MPILLRIARWIVEKFAVAALIVLLGLAAYGLWLFLKDNVDVDRRRAEEVHRLTLERDRLQRAKVEVEQRIEKFKTELTAQQARVEQARKVIAGLRALESWWDRVFGDAQQAINADRLQRAEQIEADSKQFVADLKRQITTTNWEKDGVEIALRRVETDLRRLEASKSTAAHYFRRAWDRAKWYVVIALAGYFLGPTLWAGMMFYGFAPLAMRGRPIRFTTDTTSLPTVGESHVSVEAVLRPGDVLRIKEKFLQASDEGVKKKTRFVLDWRIPFTSMACGLVELVELRAEGLSERVSPAVSSSESSAVSLAAGYRVTLSNGEDPHLELALIEIPEGGALILRPSFLAGVIQRDNQPLQIRRHWQILRWQAWVTGQFRFFEFLGPCRLVVAGSRGVRAEVLVEREGTAAPARRTNQDATIGFTPNLSYRPVRAETFWSYYRGMNPLFDDLFAGKGLFLLQETSTRGDAAKAARFWSGVWNGVLKVLGL